MMIKVQYQDYRYDFVNTRALDRLLDRREIRRFRRPSQKMWIDVVRDPIRGSGGDYWGPNRRKLNN